MSYIGNPIVSTDFPVDYKSGNGSTTAFTLSIAPASVNSIDVQISGVSQSPQTYSVSGTTLTFSAAPPTGTNNIVVRHLGIAGIPNVPAVGSVTPALLSTANAVYWDGSGKVGIGTTSPLNQFVVSNSGAMGLEIVPTGGVTSAPAFYSYNRSGAAWAPLTYYANYHVFGVSGTTEAMRIDSSGKVGIGTTSPGRALNISSGGTLGTQLQINGTTDSAGLTLFPASGNNWEIQATASSNLIFYNRTTSNQAITVDANGNLLVGTATPLSSCHTITKNVTGISFAIQNDSGSGSQTIRSKMDAAANNTSSYHFVGTSGSLGADKVYIYGNGNIVNTNNSYGALSDQAIKENIVDASPKLDDLMQVKIRNYNLIDDEAQTKQLGVVAQELEEVFPSMIEVDGISGLKQVKYSVFVPMLVKAIQEQQAMIEELKTKVAALEAK